MSADTEISWARSATLNCTKLKQETEGCVEVQDLYELLLLSSRSNVHKPHKSSLTAEKYQAIKDNLCSHLSLEKRAKDFL